ncbi:MAG: aconitate hydratase AcnA [Gemmataceae bacterium]
MGNKSAYERVLRVNGTEYRLWSLAALAGEFPDVNRLPYSLKILLENLLRHEDGETVTGEDIAFVATWRPDQPAEKEIAFQPARVLMQDFTGVPALVDLASMRDAIGRLGGNPAKVNPLVPAELVIDHSVQVDYFGIPEALTLNARLEFERNRERYAFLRWGQKAFRNFKVVPPDTGIVHQVNLEFLARVVFAEQRRGVIEAYPDTLVGTDSHTTMINGLGVLGWGVGGIEAEAALLGQPMPLLVPPVVGFRLVGRLRPGSTATDLVLTVTELLRRKGVVGKFVEFFGDGLACLSLADRATIANMAPEYGATCGYFPIDEETLRYLRLTGRAPEAVHLVEAYAKEQGLFYRADAPPARYSDLVELDLESVEPSLAGPSRPQDRVRLSEVPNAFRQALDTLLARPGKSSTPARAMQGEGGPVARSPATVTRTTAVSVSEPSAGMQEFDPERLPHGAVVIAAITSCTNTSNPSVLIAAGLLAQKAVARGLRTKPWVKTSLAPGSRVVSEYLRRAGLLDALETLRFHLVGYGCTTCIGNSGPLPEAVSRAIADRGLVAVAVLSGNRNFEGRIHPEVRANYLASPPLVVAYALAGRITIDWASEPIGLDTQGRPVYLRDIWPREEEIRAVADRYISSELFRKQYADIFAGGPEWQALPVPEGELYTWDEASTYVRRAPYFDGLTLQPPPVEDVRGARVLVFLGDSITTDHISPAGSIRADSPAGRYLIAHGVAPHDFNSYGARRGNHEVMIRGTFASTRLRNRLVPDREGGFTRHFPDGQVMTIFEAAERYRQEQVPLIVLAGKEYGSGSSRDWAAKGPALLGVRAVIAASFERIHRSNLVGMGIVPLQFDSGCDAQSLALSGEEVYCVSGLAALAQGPFQPGRKLHVTAESADGTRREFSVIARIDTPKELEYYRHGGILPYVLRRLMREDP